MQLMARYSAHGGTDRDRETGISCLEEALASDVLTGSLRATGQLAVAQLYLARASSYLQAGGFGRQAFGGVGPEKAVADIDRAVTAVHAILNGSVGEEFTDFAETLLELATAVRTVLEAVSGGVARVDLNALQSAFARMGSLQARLQGSVAGYRMPGPGMMAEALLPLDPLDRPVAVVQGAQPATEAETMPAVEVPTPPDTAQLRQALHDLVRAAPGVADVPLWSAAVALLRRDAPPLDVATVDEIAALASSIVDDPPDPDPAVCALDAFVLAVALLLRDRIGGMPGADRRAGAARLLNAALQIPLDHPACVVILSSLGAFLSEGAPLDDVMGTIGGRFADRLDRALLETGLSAAEMVTLHALRCVCRAAESLAELRISAGTVPVEYPWWEPIRAAGRRAESAIL